MKTPAQPPLMEAPAQPPLTKTPAQPPLMEAPAQPPLSFRQAQWQISRPPDSSFPAGISPGQIFDLLQSIPGSRPGIPGVLFVSLS